MKYLKYKKDFIRVSSCVECFRSRLQQGGTCLTRLPHKHAVNSICYFFWKPMNSFTYLPLFFYSFFPWNSKITAFYTTNCNKFHFEACKHSKSLSKWEDLKLYYSNFKHHKYIIYVLCTWNKTLNSYFFLILSTYMRMTVAEQKWSLFPIFIFVLK